MQSGISSLLVAAEQGDPASAEALFAALYAELHRLAGRELGRHRFPVSISATTLLHEAYLDMAGQRGPTFPDRARFMSYAARVMRGLIIDYVRRRHARKRGGEFEITSLDSEAAEPAIDDRELTRLSEALDQLAKTDPSLAEIVDLKYCCGFSFSEIGQMRGVTERTLQRHWDKVRIYLYRSCNTDVSQ